MRLDFWFSNPVYKCPHSPQYHVCFFVFNKSTACQFYINSTTSFVSWQALLLFVWFPIQSGLFVYCYDVEWGFDRCLCLLMLVFIGGNVIFKNICCCNAVFFLVFWFKHSRTIFTCLVSLFQRQGIGLFFYDNDRCYVNNLLHIYTTFRQLIEFFLIKTCYTCNLYHTLFCNI